MTVGVSFNVTGTKEVIARMAALEPKIRKKIFNKAARQSIKLIQQAAQANAPHKSGALRKSIKVRAKKKSRKYFGIFVGSGEKWFTGDQYYAAFQEFGWKGGKRTWESRKNIAQDRRRQIPGKHFLERAYESHGSKALQDFTRLVPKLIEQIA